MKRRILLAAGLCVLLPTLGTAQAPPIQDDPLAKEHVLRLPPATPQTGDAAATGAPQYGIPQVQTPQYGGQPQPYQGGGADPTPYAPRYGGSLLGAPNGQAQGAAPAYAPGQTTTPVYGSQPPQAGAAVPPVQSPRYDNGSASQPTGYGTVTPNGAGGPYGGPGSSITQEPLAPPTPLPPPQASTPDATPPPATAPQAAPAQSGTDAQAAPPSQPPAPDTPKTATATATPAPEVPNVWLPAGVARLQALDKVNAQASTLTIKVGQSATFGSLTITVKSCVVRPPDQPADAAAFVDVTDSHPDSSGFKGWLLENEPSVSIMQHPIYDLRVAGCA